MTIQNKNLNKPLDKNELEELNTALGSAGFSISYLHGLFCAVISAPILQMPSSWLQPLYDDLEFESKQHGLRATELMMRFHNEVSNQLGRGDFKPFIYKDRKRHLEDMEIAQDWSIGYLEGVGSDPMWSRHHEEDEEMKLLLAPFMIVAGYYYISEMPDVNNDDVKQEMLDRLEDINGCFFEMWRHFRRNQELLPHDDKSLPFYRDEKQGRNELCACGSGKKYKKCCLNVKVLH